MPMEYELLARGLAIALVGSPLALIAFLGLWSLIDRPCTEQTSSRAVLVAILTGLAATLGISGLMLVFHQHHLTVNLGNWISIPQCHYHFSVKLLFDFLSLPFVLLTYMLCGTIAAFATKYMHREPGYNRFFVLYAIFLAGMTITSLAGTIETMFAGWELVGLSSALLVAFFHERPVPVRNGLRVWIVYRVSDAALLIASILLHLWRGTGDFDTLLGATPWPESHVVFPEHQALIVGFLFLIAAAGKSALVPFSGWLPRAMEGPTPSSAVFYGALSVHLGAFLLLRVSPILEHSAILCWLIVALGLTTAIVAALAGRVQTDIKCALSFASLTQVGIIVAEIGLGFRWIALAHLLGHACLRTLQFLRAPSLLQDYRSLENAIGSRLSHGPGIWERIVPNGIRVWCYRLALERGYLDAFLNDYVARPFLNFFQVCDRWERKWTDLLAGGASRESDLVRPSTSEEIL